MKLNNHANNLKTNVENNVSHDFKIGNAAVVIDILRNRLYEKPIQTLVQEYICNARDAMREADKPEHEFNITIPIKQYNHILGTNSTPTFSVRDFGPGISPDRMENIFTLYGSSTKRGDNSQTGGFGIGAKSAWAYTDSFTITSVTDGFKRVYVAHTGVSSNGRLELLSEAPTNEPTGTEISLAVKNLDIEQFEQAVYRAVSNWENIPNVINGTVPVQEISYSIDNLDLIKQERNNLYYKPETAIIDGIPYSLANFTGYGKNTSLSELSSYCKTSMNLKFPTGVLEVSASRESIAQSENNNTILNNEAKRLLKLIESEIKEKFKVSTVLEWINVHKHYFPLFDITNEYVGFDGYQIQDRGLSNSSYSINNDTGKPTVRATLMTPFTKSQRRYNRNTSSAIPNFENLKKENVRYIPLSLLNNVYYNSLDESVQITNKRIKEAIKNSEEEIIILSSENQDSLKKIVSDLNAQDIASVSFPIVPRQKREKIKTTQDSVIIRTVYRSIREVLLNNLSTTYLYLELKDNTYSQENLIQLQDHYAFEDSDFQICYLSKQAIEQVKDISHFKCFKEWVQEYKPTDQDFNDVKQHHVQNLELWDVLKNQKTKDKIINEMIKDYKSLRNPRYDSVPAILKNKIEGNTEIIEFISKENTLNEHIKKNLPILECLDLKEEIVDEIVYYINSKV